MKMPTLAVIGIVSIALVACSESKAPPSLMNDINSDALNANNYRTKLQTALTQLRGAHFAGFIEAPDMANQLFQQHLPDATEYFGPEPFPLGSASANCDSGSVSRDITASDAQLLTINASYNFVGCLLGGQLHDGQVHVELDGDAPSRLGGQVGVVTILIDNMEIKSGDLYDVTRSLNGRFKNSSGWGAAYIGYTHEYVTDSYREVSDSADISINNANYIQRLESDYYPEDNFYYRLTEVGSLMRSGTIDQREAGYSISIDPTLLYSSKFDVNNRPVYDDNIYSGAINYTSVSGGSVKVTQAIADISLANYEINDGVQMFSETEEWAFPIDCNDNSVMNKRNLCDNRI